MGLNDVSQLMQRGLAILALALWFQTAGAVAQGSAARLDEIRAQVEQAEGRLAGPAPPDEVLDAVRDIVTPLQGELRAIIEAETPRRNAVEQRLKQLGEPPAANAPPESADIARQRDEQQRLFTEAQDQLKLAALLRDRADGAAQAVIDLRRARFTRQLLAPSASVLSPALWIDVARSAPQQLNTVIGALTIWSRTIASTVGWTEIGALIAGLGALLAAFRPFRRWAHSFEERGDDVAAPTRLQRASAALKVIIGATLAPFIGISLGYLLLKELGFLPGRLEGIGQRIETGLIFVAFVRAVGWAILPIQKPQWRFFQVSDAQARTLQSLMLAIAFVIFAGGVLDELNRATFANLSITVAARGVVALLVAVLIIEMLRRSRNDGEPLSARLRFGLFAAAIIILGSALLGYVALASFAIDQLVWISSILIFVALLLVVINEFVGRELSSRGVLGAPFGQVVGIGGNVVDQFGVLLTAALRVALIVFAGFLMLAPWGVDGADLFGTLRAVFFGFSIGGVSISLSTVAAALGVFVAGFLITRAAQRWLGESYLPHTKLDQGLRNSISTSFGYIGVIIAAVIALSQAGFSLDRIAIVAGALSVGIGFGLQSIVNNFVSG